MRVPTQPKIYHICHVDRLPSILEDGYLWCDAEIARRSTPGSTIGMNEIKQRRMNELTLTSHPDLHVGDCVPFYFCPRSVMLYLIYQADHPKLSYRGGQDPIIHLEADLRATVEWANQEDRRWAFTLSNAGAYYCEDRANLNRLHEVNWVAVAATHWSGQGVSPDIKEGKQAEFLVEQSFPWHLVERIGVNTRPVYRQAVDALPADGHRPRVEIVTDWYY